MCPVKVLCIGGSDSSGGAGIQADLKAVSACGCYGLTVITAITAQNTRGVKGIFAVPGDFISQQLDVVLSDIGADAVKTGMLLTEESVEAVAEKVKEYHIKKLVVDPVMIAKGGRSLMLAGARTALVKKLLPLALVITPNISEAEELAQMEIKSGSVLRKAALIIHQLGAQNVVIKGGHWMDKGQTDAVDVLFDGKNYVEYSLPRIESNNTHGTGCTYASVLAAGLAQGENISTAVQKAKKLVTFAIKNSVSLGAGHGSVNVFTGKIDNSVCTNNRRIK